MHKISDKFTLSPDKGLPTSSEYSIAGGRMKCESTNKNSFLLIVLLIFIDQLTKYIIRYFGGFYICNEGIAFGINLPNWLILVFGIAIILSVSALSLNSKFKILNQFSSSNLKLKNLALILNFKFLPYGISLEQKISNFALVLILSGAISNLFDRLYFGCVIDFIDLKVWPVFNLADIFICLGVFLLIIKSSSPSGRGCYVLMTGEGKDDKLRVSYTNLIFF